MKRKLVILLVLFSSLMGQDLKMSGSVISDNEKIITSRFMGFVTKVNVFEGKHVKKGELLYSIDSKEIDSKLLQVKLGISQAELSLQMYINQYDNLKLNLNRHKRLLSKDMVSKYEVENLELAEKNLSNLISISKKQVEQAKSQLEEVKNQYQYLNIKAPNNGVIISKNIKVGEMAIPGVPSIVLSDLSDLKIITDISESNMKFVKIGKEVTINIESLNLTTVGKISAIIPNLNQMTHSFKVKISFNQNDDLVYPGMYSTVLIKE